MMIYIADTHALVKYLIDKLPEKARSIFKSSEDGECVIFIPVIVLAECFYLIKTRKIELDFELMISKIENSLNFVVVPFNMEILKFFGETNLTDIHDQIIVSTTKYLKGVLISRDGEIRESGEVEVVWG